MAEIKIVDPILEDARGSIEVQYKAWLATYPNEEHGITREDIEERYENAFEGPRLEKREKLITHPEPNERMWVAKEGDKVVGICYLVKKEGKNQLQAIYVLPEYQGQGIGARLWEEGRKFFDSREDVYVELATYNAQAERFYKKLGFVDTGRRFQDERFRMKSGAILPEMEMVLKAGK